jgi:hypothetical protein
MTNLLFVLRNCTAKSFAILAAISVLFGQTPAFADIFRTLGDMGIASTGTVKESESLWCVFNDWKARDEMKSMYTGKNLNFSTTLGGIWFCVQKE